MAIKSEGTKKTNKKATWICPLVCFNAPKLPGGMNLWLSPSGLPRHSHLLSNLLKNGPERKKQKEPFRLKTFAGRKCVCLREEKWEQKFGLGGEKQINTIFLQSHSSHSQWKTSALFNYLYQKKCAVFYVSLNILLQSMEGGGVSALTLPT